MPEPTSVSLPREVYVFGAGGFGLRVARACAAIGIEVLAIVDRDAQRDTGEFAYVALADAEFTQRVVLLGIHNPGADVQRIHDELRNLGAATVLTPPAYVSLLSVDASPLENYWLTAMSPAVGDAAVAAVRALLVDDESRSCFDRTVRYRSLGAVEDARPEHVMAEQYLPNDFDFLTDGMRYVDVGAFDGDTVRALRSHCAEAVAAIFAFEPDPENYGRVVQELTNWPGLEWQAAPLAADAHARTLRFASTPGGSASASDAGETVVQAVALDDLVLHWAPTHIKMDIEGAEPDALLGLMRTLRTHRPRLAISVYHAPDHHWTIVHWLQSLRLGYKFYLRAYGQQTFDTVVYAVPAPDRDLGSEHA